MNNKPTGPAAAARELWEPLKKVFQAANLTPNPNMVTNIEAIILKHCPDDKGAEKLMEAFIEARVRLGFPVGTQPNYTGHFGHDFQAMVDTVKIIDAAIADYEANK